MIGTLPTANRQHIVHTDFENDHPRVQRSPLLVFMDIGIHTWYCNVKDHNNTFVDTLKGKIILDITQLWNLWYNVVSFLKGSAQGLAKDIEETN